MRRTSADESSGTGTTCWSLVALYRLLCEEYDISIFPAIPEYLLEYLLESRWLCRHSSDFAVRVRVFTPLQVYESLDVPHPSALLPFLPSCRFCRVVSCSCYSVLSRCSCCNTDQNTPLRLRTAPLPATPHSYSVDKIQRLISFLDSEWSSTYMSHTVQLNTDNKVNVNSVMIF